MKTEKLGEFETMLLEADGLALRIVPELGGKILNLIDPTNQVDWLWAPEDGRGLFRNTSADPFSQSTLAGADECFPTVAACRWNGRDLPDHGELWAVPWQVTATGHDFVELEVHAPLSPFLVRRRITLGDDTARFKYTVRNLGAAPESFLWAFHPLLRFDAGDRLEIPATSARVDSQINTPLGDRGARIALPEPAPGLHLHRLDFGTFGKAAVKYFTDHIDRGHAALVRPGLGRRLVFRFDPAELNTIGVWINAGGWENYRHVAIEPTNGAPDPLDTAAAWNRCTTLPPKSDLTWSLSISLQKL